MVDFFFNMQGVSKRFLENKDHFIHQDEPYLLWKLGLHSILSSKIAVVPEWLRMFW